MDDELNHLLEQLDLQLDLNPDPDPDPHNTPESLNAHISIHTLTGQTSPQTLWVQGIIGRSTITIPVDSGSTHNFVQERVAKFLGLQLCQAQPFSVLVGSREKLQCDTYCLNVSLKIDLVLGIQWLKSLGLVLTDFETLTMKFIKNGKVIQL